MARTDVTNSRTISRPGPSDDSGSTGGTPVAYAPEPRTDSEKCASHQQSYTPEVSGGFTVAFDDQGAHPRHGADL